MKRSPLRFAAAVTAALFLLLLGVMISPLVYRAAKAQTMLDPSPFLLMWEQNYGPGVTSQKITGASANVAAASAIATLAGAVGKTTYISHFRCEGGGATAAQISTITVSGIATSHIHQMGVVAGATAVNVPVDHVFDPPQPATATNTAIVVTMVSLGTGNTNASCIAEGFQL